MADGAEQIEHVGDEYDEEADSDFRADDAVSDEFVSSSDNDDDDGAQAVKNAHGRKRRKIQHPHENPGLGELDSGDEATIQHSARNRKRNRDIQTDHKSGDDSEGWQARTRAMRERDKEKLKKNKLATAVGSTVDVDKMWEEMNKPLSHTSIHVDVSQPIEQTSEDLQSSVSDEPEAVSEKENIRHQLPEEVITIKRTYEFAGEMHTEEKTVPKSSAEGRLWISQEAVNSQTSPIVRDVLRPLRKFSRYDPNIANLAAFSKMWDASYNALHAPKGTRLNVVEKSKMDWAAHVDNEGLQEELDEHAKAKGGYLNRMDFLRQVEQRREDDARTARLKP